MGLNAPCKDCKERELNCHSTCERYLEFQKVNNDRKEAIKADKMASIIHRDFVINQVNKMSRRYR